MRLTVVGLGIKEDRQMTLEGVEALRKASTVLYISGTDSGAKKLLDANMVKRREDLGDLYKDGALDLDNYKALFKRIISVCKIENEVCLLLPGHPRVGVTILQWLEGVKDVLGLELIVLEGVSSFCTMINDLKLDPLEHGSAVVDCNRLLRYDYEIEPNLDYFLYHICSIGVAETHMSDASKSNRLDLLQAKLMRHYPESHPVILMSSAINATKQSEMLPGTIANLVQMLPKIHFGSTLHIPAAARIAGA